MSNMQQREFGKWRGILWPIHRHELIKALPMFGIMFCICFNYSVLRNMKDALVVTARSSGAEVIPFIKVWIMLPGAFFATFLYTRLIARWRQEKVFYMMMTGFLVFYLLFTFFVYPNTEFFHPHASADRLEQILPLGLKGFVAMYRNWTFTAFYVMCELWGCLVLTVLFWGFANQITSVREAKRFFGVFTIGGNLAAIAAGQVSIYITRIQYQPQFYGTDSWEQTLVSLVLLVSLSGVVALSLFYWLNKNVIQKDPTLVELDLALARKNKQTRGGRKASLRDSFAYLTRSRYLVYIAVMVVSYNLVINLVEVIFKDRLRELCPNPEDFNTYMNQLTSLMGIISTVLAILIAYLVQRFGWTLTALITPVSMLITSCGFFAFLFFPEAVTMQLAGLLSTTPLAMAAVFGGLQNCFSKAAKYSVFDATKEMTFIPLPIDVKMNGKAAIDGVGSRVGKSGGSLIHQGLLMMFGTLMASAGYVAIFLIAVIIVWIYCTRALGREFEEVSSVGGAEAKPASVEVEVVPKPATA